MRGKPRLPPLPKIPKFATGVKWPKMAGENAGIRSEPRDQGRPAALATDKAWEDMTDAERKAMFAALAARDGRAAKQAKLRAQGRKRPSTR